MKLLGFVVRLLAKYAFVGVAIFFPPSGTKYSSYSRSRPPPPLPISNPSYLELHVSIINSRSYVS